MESGKRKGMANLRPFKKGDPNINRKGRPRKLPEIENLMAEVLGADEAGKSKAKAIVEAITKKAMKGDVHASSFLFGYSFGLPKQKTDITSNGQAIYAPMTDNQVDKVIDALRVKRDGE